VEHKRYIGYIDENTVVVLDYVNAELNDEVKSYVHFVPGTEVDIRNDVVSVINANETIKIIGIGASKPTIQEGWYSPEFNVKEENKALSIIKADSKKAFGYLIELNNHNSKLVETENEIKIINKKEVIINIDELGDIL
jgi:hypothetical protein